MKKNISMITILIGFAILFAGALIMSSCEGPQGAPGIDGKDGINGTDGVDANATCIVCHNNEVVLLAKEQQTMSSHHLTGGNYDRSHADCSICHTHQGFVETIENGDLEASADIVDPAPINCRTCHLIHNNYDESDWTLVSTTPVDLDFGEGTIDMGTANLCVNCHQFRPVDPMPELGGGTVEITSSRWGVHHGPQGNNVWGIGGYLIAGSKSYPAAGSHKHAEVGCNGCHMAPQPYGATASGGHTFNMTDGPGGSENIEACTGCHTTLEDDFDYNGVQTTVEGLLADLEEIFVAKGWIDEPGALWNASSDDPLSVTSDEAGAMLNYDIVAQDRSLGIHNPAYIVALLTNSLESLQK
jgi:hypothetical protein